MNVIPACVRCAQNSIEHVGRRHYDKNYNRLMVAGSHSKPNQGYLQIGSVTTVVKKMEPQNMIKKNISTFEVPGNVFVGII